MTTSNYITFILLGVIGLVFLIDYILTSRKKPLEKSVEKFVEKEKSEGKSSFKWLNWILDRKKNFTLSILIISILKLLTHFFLYRTQNPNYRTFGTYYYNKKPVPDHQVLELAKEEGMSVEDFAEEHGLTTENYYAGCNEFVWHLEKIYIDTVWLFIPVTILFLILVWFFNDKIKAR